MSIFNDEPCVFGTCLTCDILQQAGETKEQWFTRLCAAVKADTRTSDACANGHPWTDATIYWHPDGRRVCRICKRESGRRERQRQGAA